MNNDTKVRWDEARRGQFGATATTVFTLASAAIAYISSLLTEGKAQFGGAATCFFLWTVVAFIISLGLGVAAMVTRLEDFRATARIVRLRDSSRAEDQAAVVRLRDRASSFGTSSYFLLYGQIAVFAIGATLLALAVWHIFYNRLHP
jgi:ATP/ADP translocase